MSPRKPERGMAGAGGEPAILRAFRRTFRWEGVEVEPYKIRAHRGGEFCGASRQVIVGKRGERVAFHVRYFELEPGGFTSLERHHHSHVVIAVRGRGSARVGLARLRLKPLDAIYIGPDEPHQLRASAKAKFGFFCIVDAKRDKPRPAEPRSVPRTTRERQTASGAEHAPQINAHAAAGAPDA